jgi:hypothetical protein
MLNLCLQDPDTASKARAQEGKDRLTSGGSPQCGTPTHQKSLSRLAARLLRIRRTVEQHGQLDSARGRNYWALLGISETEGKRRQARAAILAKTNNPLILLASGFGELPGAAGVRMIGAQGALKVFDRGPGGCSGFIGLTLGHEDTGEKEMSAA